MCVFACLYVKGLYFGVIIWSNGSFNSRCCFDVLYVVVNVCYESTSLSQWSVKSVC